jgi:hypothetical protein
MQGVTWLCEVEFYQRIAGEESGIERWNEGVIGNIHIEEKRSPGT